MKNWTWRDYRPGVCKKCEGWDVASTGSILHARWCREVGGSGKKPLRALPVLPPEEAARLRRLRTVR